MSTMKTDFKLWKFIVFGFLTFGIYRVWLLNRYVKQLNSIVSPRDGKKSMNAWLVLLIVMPLTFFIAFFVWMHRITVRIAEERRIRNMPSIISPFSFWGWYVLGTWIIIGPWVFYYKLFSAMNELAEAYNESCNQSFKSGLDSTSFVSSAKIGYYDVQSASNNSNINNSVMTTMNSQNSQDFQPSQSSVENISVMQSDLLYVQNTSADMSSQHSAPSSVMNKSEDTNPHSQTLFSQQLTPQVRLTVESSLPNPQSAHHSQENS